MEMIRLSPPVFASGQITPGDLAELAATGFTDVVCHRPDSEHPEGHTSAQIAQEARLHDLNLHYLPIVLGEPFAEQAAGLARVASTPASKVLVYCKSGALAARAWELGHPSRA